MRSTEKWKVFRALIRSKYTCCAICGKIRKLEIHHIIPVKVDGNLAFEESNVILLCRRCHKDVGHCGDSGKFYNPCILQDLELGYEKAKKLARLHKTSLE